MFQHDVEVSALTTPRPDDQRSTIIRDRVHGVVPVLPTPFHDDGQLDLESFEREAAASMDLGVRAVMYPGFASEYFSLTWDEKLCAIDRLLPLAQSRQVAVLASVTDGSADVGVSRALEYVRHGADALNVMPPTGPCSADDVTEHWTLIADAAAPTPVVLQYVPTELGAAMTPQQLQDVTRSCPNIVGIKVESRPSRIIIRALAETDPVIPCLVGQGGVELIAALQAGAIGVQPGGGFIEIYVEICRRWDAGDTQGAIQLYRALLHYLTDWQVTRSTLTQVGKVISWRRGRTASPRCRVPVPDLDDVTMASVDAFLAEFSDVLGWTK